MMSVPMAAPSQDAREEVRASMGAIVAIMSRGVMRRGEVSALYIAMGMAMAM